MFAETKMFYKFETDYVYHPDFHLVFDNYHPDSRFISDIVDGSPIYNEIDKYMESSEEAYIRHELVDNVLFELEDTARYFLYNWLMGEVKEYGYDGWDCIPIPVSVQDLPEDEHRFLVYDGKNLVAVIRLKRVGYSFV